MEIEIIVKGACWKCGAGVSNSFTNFKDASAWISDDCGLHELRGSRLGQNFICSACWGRYQSERLGALARVDKEFKATSAL